MRPEPATDNPDPDPDSTHNSGPDSGPGSGPRIRQLGADEALDRIGELVAILRDSVEDGASMNFLAHVSDDELEDFWQASIAEQARNRRILLVAEIEDRIAGTAMLIFAHQQNSPHRADVGKMIVHRDFRRQRLAARLLTAVEATAMENGRTLLMFDTETDSAGEHLYVAGGWTRFGIVPDHAFKPDGTPKPTTFFYKQLAEPVLDRTPADDRP
jgi:GNAT superfamily N-acetyltransferase